MDDEAFFASPISMFLFRKRISFEKLTEKSNIKWDFDIDIQLQHANKAIDLESSIPRFFDSFSNKFFLNIEFSGSDRKRVFVPCLHENKDESFTICVNRKTNGWLIPIFCLKINY